MKTEFGNFLNLIKSLENINLKFRIVDIQNESSGWSSWISNPTGTYVDFGFEPLPYREIIEVHIDPVEDKYIGKLVSNKLIDHTDKIYEVLNNLKITYFINNKIIVIQ